MKNITILPSNNGWITPRSEEVHLTDQNALILFNQKVENIHKVLVHLPNVRVQLSFPTRAPSLKEIYLDSKYKVSLADLDITKYIVTEEEYKTLDAYNAAILPDCLGDKYLNNTWYYTKEKIVLLNDTMKGNLKFQGHSVFYSLICSAIYNIVYNNGQKNGKLYVHFDSETANDLDVTVTYSDNFSVGYLGNYFPDIRNIPFRIYYTPLGETVSLTTPKTEPQEHQFTIPFSQQQPIVSSQAMDKNMQATANRTGVPVRIVKRKVSSVKLIRKIGTIWREKDKDGKPTGDIWRLTAQDIVVQGGYAICTERWSKNWMMQSEFVGINREFRSWKIPADIVQRVAALLVGFC